MPTEAADLRGRGGVRALACLWCALWFGVLGSVPANADADKGEQEFVAQKCDKCHSVESREIAAKTKSEKMKGPDLSKVGSEHDAEWMEQYLLREIQLNDKDHKAEYEGGKKQLKAIVDWLAELKE